MSDNNSLIPFDGFPERFQPQIQRFLAMTPEQRWEALSEGLKTTADGLMKMAFLVRIVEQVDKRDLRELKRLPLFPWLRRIAYGQVLPEVMLEFGCSTPLLKAVSRLPIPEQQRAVSGESFPLVILDEKGQRTTRMYHPLDLSLGQMGQLFAEDCIRTPEQQLMYLDDKREKASTPVPEQVGIIRLDVDAEQLIIGRHRVSLVDADKAVRMLKRAVNQRPRT